MAHSSSIKEIESLVQRYKSISIGIRKYDLETSIVLEPSFWSDCEMLDLLIKCLENERDFFDEMNIILFFHFYEPKNLTFKNHGSQNCKKYVYPGHIPKYLHVKN